MRLVVEEINLRRVRGWALIDGNSTDRLQVVGRIGAEQLFSVTSDIYRKDLHDNNVGDGRYGFQVDWPHKTWQEVQNNWSDFELVGRQEGVNEEVTAEYAYGTPNIIVNTNEGRLSSETFLGDCFFLENIQKEAIDQIGLDSRFERPRVQRLYFCMRTCCFGDYLWWDETNPSVRSAARLFKDIGPHERDLIEADKMVLVFDMSSEGPPANHYSDWHVLLHDEMKSQNIRPSSCIMINQNRYYEFDYRLWCKQHNYSDRMHVLYYDYYIARLAALLDQDALGYCTKLPSNRAEWRHFLCLNFTPRPERVAFVSWLFGKTLNERGFISFAGFQNLKADGRDFDIPGWFPDHAIAVEGMEKLRSIGAIQLDLTEETSSKVPEFSMGPSNAVEKSFFTIVTESDFTNGDVLRITEKSIKPLAYGHPCIIVGNPGSLRILREFGFKTFSPWIDESYDEIDEPARRMAAIQKEVNRLCAMTFDQLETLRNDLKPIVSFNYLYARRGLANAYRERFHVDLIRQIARSAPLQPHGGTL